MAEQPPIPMPEVPDIPDMPDEEEQRRRFDALVNKPIPSMEEVEANLTTQAIAQIPHDSVFFMENWGPRLHALSVQSSGLRLDSALARILGEFVEAGFDQSTGIDPWAIDGIYDIARFVDQMITGLGGRVFTRLGSRSAKDNPEFLDSDCRPVPLYNARQVLNCLSYSERIYLDLGDARRASYTPWLWLRRWIDIDPDQEFRCFIDGGLVAGITQYYLQEGENEPLVSSWIKRNERAIESTLRHYIDQAVYFAAEMDTSMDSLTADIVLTRDMRPTLLEINPPVSEGRTFPGLFADGKFDGSFRYNR